MSFLIPFIVGVVVTAIIADIFRQKEHKEQMQDLKAICDINDGIIKKQEELIVLNNERHDNDTALIEAYRVLVAALKEETPNGDK